MVAEQASWSRGHSSHRSAPPDATRSSHRDVSLPAPPVGPGYQPPAERSDEDVQHACPILVTRLVMFDRSRAHQYFAHVLALEDTLVQQKPWGHGEDLLLSLLSIKESGGKLNRVWRGALLELGSEEMVEGGVGVSRVNDDHLTFRTYFMRLVCYRLGLPCERWIVAPD